MLPLGVLAQKLLSDPAGRNRLIGAMLAMVLLIGAFATGLSINIELGDTGDDAPLALTTRTDPDTGEEVLVDEAGDVVDDGTLAGAGTPTTAAGTDAAGADGGSPAPAPSTPASGDGDGGQAGSIAAPADETDGSDGAAGSVQDPAASGDQGDDRCAGAQLSATDQGVTEETVKLGFLIPNLNELSAAGFNVGLAGDYERVIGAWIEELNRTGGIACREVIWVKENFDVLSADDMNAKCKTMTEDHEVFSVITPGGYDSVAQLCVAKDHQTPLVNPEPEPAHWYEEAQPYLWNTLMSKDRMHRNHVRWLVENGELEPSSATDLDGSQKVGVVYHGIPNVAPSVEAAMLPELEANGITPEEVVKLSADTERAISEINQVVLEFNAAGIDYVFMPMNLIFKTQFMQQAENQNYFPTYTDSDHYFGCYDFVTDTYPEDSWDQTVCVTADDTAGRPDLEEYVDNHPYAQYADEVYHRSYPDGYDRDGEDDEETANTQRALFYSMGTLILLWDEAGDRVGPELTRARWGESMGQTGQFHKCICENPITFGPQKWDGPDVIKSVQWHAEAGEGYEERTYREHTRPQRAYY